MTLPKNYGLEETVHCPVLDLNVQDVSLKKKCTVTVNPEMAS